MSKNYLMYGVVAVLISLLVYMAFGLLKVDGVNSNKIENNIDEEVNGVDTKEGSLINKENYISNKSKDQKGICGSKDIIYGTDNAAQSQEPKDGMNNDKELNENKSTEVEIKETTEEDIKDNGKYDIIEVFDAKISPDLLTNIKYEKYPMGFSYVVILVKNANIREAPEYESKALRKVLRNEKINLSKAVKGQYIEKYDSDIWYKVYWEDKGEKVYGYMIDKVGETRNFRVNEMEKFLNKLKIEVDSNKTAYISNYKNTSGVAPLYKGKAVDKYGARKYQAAPGYANPDYESEFRYFPDGALLSVLEEKDEFFKVRTLNFMDEYWIPKKYVSLKNSIEELKKVVVIDRKNQNETVFEYSEDKWSLVSHVLATTGQKGRYKLETPLGYYMVIEKRPSFVYYSDGTKKIAGFAPYATRFTGGMYIHGIPTKFKYIEGKRVNTRASETSSTIGTIPLSHGCVRNNTSHAKFLYDWLGVGESAIIVIDESSNLKDKNSNLKRDLEAN